LKSIASLLTAVLRTPVVFRAMAECPLAVLLLPLVLYWPEYAGLNLPRQRVNVGNDLGVRNVGLQDRGVLG
jgi:hypothetical protein